MSPVYVALDLETTGLDPARDVIIEVGAVKFDGHRELAQFGSLVNPGRPIPLKITQLTGISDSDVATAPPFSALRERFLRFVGDAIIVGHNVGFDLGFLKQHNCLTRNLFIDTFRLAAILMPHESRYSLGKLADSLGISPDTHHRAATDARATMELYRALQERADQLPLKTLQILNRAAQHRDWPLHLVFRDAERHQASGTFENSIGAQLRAKGLIGDAPVLSKALSVEPLIPVDERQALDVAELAAMLEEDGLLSARFPGFEYRPQQVQMLEAVAQAFNASSHLLVEAGTGTGKSIAYLLPAIHWAVQNGERVVISTNTINLQDQLSQKDIPDLREILPFEVRASVLKGRANYLCRRRLGLMQDKRDLSGEELSVLAKVLVWLPNTVTGDRAELFMPEPSEWDIWSQISSTSDTCSVERCPYRRQGTCFFYRARQEAENAHLVIVNHALLLSDVATENRVLPPYNYLVVDEAHHLEDATTQQLGYALAYRTIQRLVSQIGEEGGTPNAFLARALVQCNGRIEPEAMEELQDRAALVHEHNGRLLRGLGDLFDGLAVLGSEDAGGKGQYDHQVRLNRSLRLTPEWEQIEALWDGLSGTMETALQETDRVLEMLRGLEGVGVPGYDDLVQDGLGLYRQLDSAYHRLDYVLTQPQADEIAWVQTMAKTNETVLWSVPLRVGHLVQQHLLWPKEAVIFTSATLCTNGDFSFIKERLGAADADELAVGSPFDFQSQVMVYLPKDIPEPNEAYHQKVLNETLVELAKATRGRMLVLFTSYSQLRAVNNAISRPLAEQDITVYAQGQGTSRTQLLENFRTTSRAVLLGTRSFWEGIDVPGEALSCLVLTKLPFAVPSDPVFAARSEDMDDPFMQYAVPDAILRFRQGFGRLIRTKTDRGVVVVMDRRLQTKQYGQMFMGSLPSCTVVPGPMAELPRQAALWIDQGMTTLATSEPQADVDDGELQYVPFDDL